MSEKKRNKKKFNKKYILTSDSIKESNRNKSFIRLIFHFLKNLPPIIVAFLSFVALNLLAFFYNQFIEKFNSGYLHAFGILSNIPIEKMTSHSKIMSFIFLTLGLILILSILYFVYRNIDKFKHHKLIFSICCFSLFYSFWLSYYLYILCLDNHFPIETVVIELFNIGIIWIISFLCTVLAFLFFFGVLPFIHSLYDKPTKSNLSDSNEEKIAKSIPYLCFSLIALIGLFFIISTQQIAFSMGESYATQEIGFPSFTKEADINEDNKIHSEIKRYIIIAKVADTYYLAIQADTITKIDNEIISNPVYQIIDISEIELIDARNPLHNNS